jgi:predicted nucleic acid-binding protein
MIFVDTGAWFASVVPSDSDHQAATVWLSTNKTPLITTDYVIDETITLLKMRGESRRALMLGERLLRGELARVHFLTSEDIIRGWKVFTDFKDKEWSFTDCTSKALMEELSITQAFAFDHHFKQFGSISVVPDSQ